MMYSLGVTYPLLILCFASDGFVSQFTRDCAQAMYFGVTLIGLVNLSTGIQLRNSPAHI